MSKSKRCFNVESSTYYFYMKMKILGDSQICISVPLIHGKRQLKEATILGNNGNDHIRVEYIKSIFTEMFKQQEEILRKTKFCFYIHQPNNMELINRNYKKIIKLINLSNEASEMQ